MKLPIDPTPEQAKDFVVHLLSPTPKPHEMILPLLWKMNTDQLCAINGPAPRWLRDMIQREMRNTDDL